VPQHRERALRLVRRHQVPAIQHPHEVQVAARLHVRVWHGLLIRSRRCVRLRAIVHRLVQDLLFVVPESLNAGEVHAHQGIVYLHVVARRPVHHPVVHNHLVLVLAALLVHRVDQIFVVRRHVRHEQVLDVLAHFVIGRVRAVPVLPRFSARVQQSFSSLGRQKPFEQWTPGGVKDVAELPNIVHEGVARARQQVVRSGVAELEGLEALGLLVSESVADLLREGSGSNFGLRRLLG